MNTEQALAILRQLRPRLAASGVAHAGLFGSIVRGTAGARSDVDIVVAPNPGTRLKEPSKRYWRRATSKRNRTSVFDYQRIGNPTG